MIDKPLNARHETGRIHVYMESGLELSFPVEGNPRLEGRPHDQLDRIELTPFGLHWPELDEDLSLQGILVGDFGQQIPPRSSLC